MSDIVEKNGFFHRVLNQDGPVETVPLIDFVYGYEERSGQKIPVTTVCVLPYIDSGELWFAIGATRLGVNEQSEKKEGRSRAEACARDVIHMTEDMRWKPDRRRGVVSPIKIDGIGSFLPPVCATKCHHLDAKDTLESIGVITSDMLDNVRKSFAWLTDKITDTDELLQT